MDPTIQNTFYVLYAILGITLLWLFLHRPSRQSLFKERQRPHKGKRKKNRLTAQEKEALRILRLNIGATQKEIMKAYREMMKHYHPDKVSHKGKAHTTLAREKTIQIQNAKETLLNQGGKSP